MKFETITNKKGIEQLLQYYRRDTGEVYELINKFIDMGVPMIKVDWEQSHYASIISCQVAINRALKALHHDEHIMVIRRRNELYVYDTNLISE